jgi:hypothetical protein
MGGDGVPRDADSYALAISACARAGGRGALARANELYSRMRAREGLQPTAMATNALIGAQARGGTADARADALRTLRAMALAADEGSGPPPDAVSFNQALDACWRARDDPPLRLAPPERRAPATAAAAAAAAAADDTGARAQPPSSQPASASSPPSATSAAAAAAALPDWLARPEESAPTPPLVALDSLFECALARGAYARAEFVCAEAAGDGGGALANDGGRADGLGDGDAAALDDDAAALDDDAAALDDDAAALDLHNFSPGAAVAAVRWWRRRLAVRGVRADALPPSLALVTGWGRRARVAARRGEAAAERGAVRRAVLEELRASGAPLVGEAAESDEAAFGEDEWHPSNPGRIHLRTAALLTWAAGARPL